MTLSCVVMLLPGAFSRTYKNMHNFHEVKAGSNEAFATGRFGNFALGTFAGRERLEMLYRAIVSRSISTSPRRYPDGTPGAFKNSGGVPSHAESIALSAPLGGQLPKPEVQDCHADKPIGMGNPR